MAIDCSKCPEGGECCGIIPLTKDLIENYKDKFQVKQTEILGKGSVRAVGTEDFHCVFMNRETKLCAIYDDRPEVCRLFGTKEGIQKKGLGLACPHFKPNGNDWSPAMKAKIKHVARNNLRKLLKGPD